LAAAFFGGSLWLTKGLLGTVEFYFYILGRPANSTWDRPDTCLPSWTIRL